MIPFSPPRIDEKICNEVLATLKSGWVTTGPRTKLFEQKISAYCGNKNTLCLNSATAGLEIMLRWFGVGPGDEVILPAYTYAATANVIIHCGATPVFVDVNAHDFNIDVVEVEKAITARTKVIMPVDFGGMPCDYKELNNIAERSKLYFVPDSDIQRTLGRILILSDAAHAFGAEYMGLKTGALTDISVFSFHAVKNLTTAEGGAIALNLPEPFDNDLIYKKLCVTILHGQDKDALAKTQPGNWRYDVVEAGYKYNMTDISAAMGLVELERYDSDTLPRRQNIVNQYLRLLSDDARFELPVFTTDIKQSSYHLFPLRIKNINEEQRDAIIQEIFKNGVSVNVHFIPVPGMSFYKSLGYNELNYKVACDSFYREISLPVYYDLSDTQVQTVVAVVIAAVTAIGC